MKKTTCHKLIYVLLSFLTSCFLLLTSLYSQNNKIYKVYEFNINQEIAQPVWLITRKAFKEARDMKADIILIHENTYGGMLDMADSIRTTILHSKIPVYVFIDNNAASAGALIAISCDRIYMRKGASIGAATVVNERGEKLDDKYQSYMRSMMRSTAQAKGRNPDIAEAIVGAIKNVDTLIQAGKVLTLTTSEAIRLHYCDGEAESVYDVLRLAGIKDYKITEQKLTAIDWLIGFFANPVVSGLLIMVIVAGIYFEFQSPGATFPIVTAGIAAVLYFAPMYMEGIAHNWEIILFIVGVIFVALEVFVFPGHGVSLTIGIVMVITGLTLTMIHNIAFKFHVVPANAILIAFFIVIIAMFGSLIGSFLLSKRLFASAVFGKRLALDTIQEKDEGYTLTDNTMKELIGKEGTAVTILRPVGRVEVNSELYQATAEIGYINKGDRIKVTGYNNSQLIVTKLASNN